MAGVLPYLATSLSTIYLAWDISYAASTGHGFLVSGQTAELLLHIVEPLQMGYGAVVSLNKSPMFNMNTEICQAEAKIFDSHHRLSLS